MAQSVVIGQLLTARVWKQNAISIYEFQLWIFFSTSYTVINSYQITPRFSSCGSASKWIYFHRTENSIFSTCTKNQTLLGLS